MGKSKKKRQKNEKKTSRFWKTKNQKKITKTWKIKTN